MHDETQNTSPSDEDIKNLRHVVDDLPITVWIASFVGAAERFTFYGLTAPWQNYMQNALDARGAPGALGLGQSRATIIYYAFFFLSYISPVAFAIISDSWLGCYKTLWLGLVLYICGCLILTLTSLPVALHAGAGVGGFAVAAVLIAFGVGGVKSTVSPFIGKFFTFLLASLQPKIKITRKGERVITDRSMTIQYIYNAYYWIVNIVSLSSIATTYLEKERGFWAAYLLPTSFLAVAVALMLIGHSKFVKPPPQSRVLQNASKVLAYAIKNRFRLETAEPSYQLERHGRVVSWDSHFVAEIRRGLVACKVLVGFIFFYLCFNQIQNNLVSQAAQMQRDGVPNDAIYSLNAAACIVLAPIMQQLLYPYLSNRRIHFRPVARITVGFICTAGGMAIAAGVQKIIYNAGPCYRFPLACPASDSGTKPNTVSVWAQTPVYVILAPAEIFASVTASEYAYSKAPKSMKVVVQAISLLTTGIGQALGLAMSPAAKDPNMVGLYSGLAGAMATVTAIFWFCFRKYDTRDAEMDALDAKKELGTELHVMRTPKPEELEAAKAV
ncbi:oligopeptide transporter [Paraphoma chrysanthemicola]|nr:oligopeptide transporter [Paraphoma chrysanthemicola]